MEMIEKSVAVRVKNPATGMNYNPIRYAEKVVKVFDTDSGQCTDQVIARRERQAKEKQARLLAWRKLHPQQQLAELDKRLGVGVGAGKQRAKIAAKIAAKIEKMKQQSEQKKDEAQVPQQQESKKKPQKQNKKRHHRH